MRLRRKPKSVPKTLPGFRLVNDDVHGGGAKVFLGDIDISSCVQRVVVDVSVGDANLITIHAIAADVAVDIPPEKVLVIERAFQLRHPNDQLTNTPLRELLYTYEEKPEDAPA